MARIRTIKPEFWVDEIMVELPYETRLLFLGLLNFVDDHGFIEYKPKRIKMMIFPADTIFIEDSLNALCDSLRLQVFDSDQGPLLRVVNWERHQKVNRPSPTRFTNIRPANRKNKPNPIQDSVSTHGALNESSVLKGKERKGKDIDTTYLYDETAEAVPREDIQRIFDHFNASLEHRGAKKLPKAKKQLDAIRLMLDRDKHTEQQIMWLIDWVTNDNFWHKHILYPTKLREKFDQLKLNATTPNTTTKQSNAAAGLAAVATWQTPEHLLLEN